MDADYLWDCILEWTLVMAMKQWSLQILHLLYLESICGGRYGFTFRSQSWLSWLQSRNNTYRWQLCITDCRINFRIWGYVVAWPPQYSKSQTKKQCKQCKIFKKSIVIHNHITLLTSKWGSIISLYIPILFSAFSRKSSGLCTSWWKGSNFLRGPFLACKTKFQVTEIMY